MDLKIANRLLEYRKKAGLSQDQLADKIGVSRQAVSKWERGEASPDTENLIALSDVYGVSLDELVKGKTSFFGENNEKTNNISGGTHISIKNGVLHIKDGEKDRKININDEGVNINIPETTVHIDKDFWKNNGHFFY